MGEVVNLRRARKARARADKERQAEQNRLVHGRPRAEREAEAAARDLAARHLDGNRLTRDEES